MTSQTDTWIEEAARLHAIHCTGCREQQHPCDHENATPDDESACYGTCDDCGLTRIPNFYAGHYPCSHPVGVE